MQIRMTRLEALAAALRVAACSLVLVPLGTARPAASVQDGLEVSTLEAIVSLIPGKQRAELSAETSASPGELVAYEWSILDGPEGSFTTPHGLTTEFLPSVAGRYVIRFSAWRTPQSRAVDDVTVYVYELQENGDLVTGTHQKWRPLTIDFHNDFDLAEVGTNSAFRNYRLQVAFHHPRSGDTYEVPGFFAADGDAANTGADSGNVWRVHFSPPHTGRWFYSASFRTGTDVAVNLSSIAGTPTGFDGHTGGFRIHPTNPSAGGFYPQGLLQYVDGQHLRFAETKEFYLKGGADSPENFLGYYEFDNTFDDGGNTNSLNQSVYADGLHHYDAHLADYANDSDDLLWQNGKGRRIFGAISYLGSTGMNSAYFLTYNTDGGDGREVFPWTSPQQRSAYDVSKLEQWNRVFEHMMRKGVGMHLVTQETENDQILNAGNLGPQRMLYYRELVARFSHHLALTWNLGEENSNTELQVRSYARYIRALDPYDHPITVHSHPSLVDQVFDPLFGFEMMEGPSLQLGLNDVHSRTIQMVAESNAAERPWVVCYDEQNPANLGLVPDAVDFWHDEMRQKALWGNLMAQGGGVEYYFGFGNVHDDLDCEDWRTRDHMWELTRYALDSFRTYLPFWRMESIDALTPDVNDYVLAEEGQIYAVYRPSGGATTLDLGPTTDTFSVRWFLPRFGGALEFGSVTQVTGPGVVSIGNSPTGGDWLAIVQNTTNRRPSILSVEPDPKTYTREGPFAIQVRVDDPDGWFDIASVVMHFFRPDGTHLGRVNLPRTGGELYTIYVEDFEFTTGVWNLVTGVVDKSGSIAFRVDEFTVIGLHPHLPVR